MPSSAEATLGGPLGRRVERGKEEGRGDEKRERLQLLWMGGGEPFRIRDSRLCGTVIANSRFAREAYEASFHPTCNPYD